LVKRSHDFVKKYYFLAELLIVEIKNISVTNMGLHK